MGISSMKASLFGLRCVSDYGGTLKCVTCVRHLQMKEEVKRKNKAKCFLSCGSWRAAEGRQTHCAALSESLASQSLSKTRAALH